MVGDGCRVSFRGRGSGMVLASTEDFHGRRYELCGKLGLLLELGVVLFFCLWSSFDYFSVDVMRAEWSTLWQRGLLSL